MGTKERREKELRQRRLLIIDKARELFFARGFDGVSVADICEAAEFGRSAIYGLFASKEEIYAHICLESLSIFTATVESLCSPDQSPPETFIACAEAFPLFFEKHPEHYKALFHFSGSTYEREKISPAVQDQIAKAEMNTLIPLVSALQQGAEKGHWSAQDFEQLVFLFWSTLNGIIGGFLCYGRESETQTIREYCLAHARIYLQGLSSPDEKP
jgi:AcrR family transcriptional regulator